MIDNPEEADLPSAPLIGWGMALLPFGGIAFLLAWQRFEPGEPAFWLVAWGILAATGWISLTAGLTRFAVKVDKMYRVGAETTSTTS